MCVVPTCRYGSTSSRRRGRCTLTKAFRTLYRQSATCDLRYDTYSFLPYKWHLIIDTAYRNTIRGIILWYLTTASTPFAASLQTFVCLLLRFVSLFLINIFRHIYLQYNYVVLLTMVNKEVEKCCKYFNQCYQYLTRRSLGLCATRQSLGDIFVPRFLPRNISAMRRSRSTKLGTHISGCVMDVMLKFGFNPM